MTRRIPTLMLIAAAITALSACETPGVGQVRGAVVTDLQGPSRQSDDDEGGALLRKWLTRPPSGVNGMLVK